MGDTNFTRMGPLPTQIDAPKVLWVSMNLDVMEALVNNTVDHSLYMFDNNKVGGSQNQGTTQLKSVVRPGEAIGWLIGGLEVETDTAVESITGPALEQLVNFHYDEEYGFFKGWVSPDAQAGEFEYSLKIRVERKVMTLSTNPSLIIER